ncbi:l-asparaginase [Fusarium sporotrichioides]|uniref:asparaginase n=1 Tax=Fusarium sporotrichioides TaxID=5514 RepID=A0A395SDW8_FUSSP|nr:l-asparaginase [Fusarium sporotrichioides]
MMPSFKRVHDHTLVATAPVLCSGPAASSTIKMASSSASWATYLRRLILAVLAPSTALLPFGAWVASVWGSPVLDLHVQPHFSVQQNAPIQTGIPFEISATSGFNCFNPNLPNITIYATGGTIAGSASSADQTTGYRSAALGVDSLIDAVPQLCNVANVRGVQFANTDSIDMSSTMLRILAKQIQDDLDSPFTQGAVVTHGTDTLDESAFFLDLTVQSDKPVVVTGSMRPATAISADGPMNLLSSVTLAATASARGRGVMIALNDRIGSARFTTKVNANHLDAFQAPDSGLLGTFVNVQPVFFYPPSRPLGHHHFDLQPVNNSRRFGRSTNPGAGSSALPQVDVLYAYQELSVGMFQAAIDLGAQGIVLAGMGAGFWTSKGTDEIRRIVRETDIPVIVSRRPEGGFVGPCEAGIGAGFLNPQKARIQLQLALEAKMDNDAIRALFEHSGVH